VVFNKLFFYNLANLNFSQLIKELILNTILRLFIINNILYILFNNINSDTDFKITLPINISQNIIYYNNI